MAKDSRRRVDKLIALHSPMKAHRPAYVAIKALGRALVGSCLRAFVSVGGMSTPLAAQLELQRSCLHEAYCRSAPADPRWVCRASACVRLIGLLGCETVASTRQPWRTSACTWHLGCAEPFLPASGMSYSWYGSNLNGFTTEQSLQRWDEPNMF